MALADSDFSDIILHEKGAAFLKGTGKHSHKLVAPCAEMKAEIDGLHQAVLEKEQGRHTYRLKYAGTSYRVAVYEGVEWGSGKVYFLRKVMEEVPSFTSLGFSKHFTEWLLDREQRKGLILFSGAQSSGKTTSASSLISTRLALHGGHAVSFENPVEMPLDGKHGEFGMCFQAEIESEDKLGEAIERAHRYASPDIIYIGEIRGKHAATETLRVALGSDQQLVVATIHGINAIAALERLVGYARQIDGEMANQHLSQGLLAIVHQRLESDGENHQLKVEDTLFLPFPKKADPDRYAGVRAKLKNNDLLALGEDMNEQESHFVLYGRRV